MTLDFLIEYQQSIVSSIRSNGSQKNLHVEEQILNVLKEARAKEIHRNGLVIIEMTPHRFRKISEIY